MKQRVYALACTFAMVVVAGAASAQAVREGDTVYANGRGKASIDYAKAKPMPLPRNTAASRSQADLLSSSETASFRGAAGEEPGGEGDGRKSLVRLPVNKAIDAGDGVAPQEYGTGNHPYTTAVAEFPTGAYHRRAGKLFFRDGSSTYVCSASLIKRGLVVTAAHCVAAFGERRFYQSIQFVPGYWRGSAPYGVWNWAQARVLNSYHAGTDACAVSGVVCQNDIAVVVLAAKNGAYPGTNTGWFGYAWGGYSYVGGSAQITQLGYPVALNGGLELMRTDSRGFVSAGDSNNTVIGSLQTGGSSGGPWIVNYGLVPTLSGGAGYGTNPNRNVVVGTTSWGYTNISSTGPKQQGASPFLSSNILALVNAACASFPAACN